MRFVPVFTATIAAILAVSAAPSKRDGPSGQVISPAGGATVSATTGYPDGKLHFVYQPVYQSKTDNCAYFECVANTQSVQVILVNSAGTNYTLADRLAPPSSSNVSNIDTYLSVPANICGSAQVIVVESQNLFGQQITFRAADPTIQINCSPLP